MSSPKYLVVCASGDTIRELEQEVNAKIDNIKSPDNYVISSISNHSLNVCRNNAGGSYHISTYNTCIRVKFVPTQVEKKELPNTTK